MNMCVLFKNRKQTLPVLTGQQSYHYLPLFSYMETGILLVLNFLWR